MHHHVRTAAAVLPALILASAAEGADIQSKEIAYEYQGTKLTGYLSYDASIKAKRPGVLVVHEWWGHNDYVRRRARMLAELGYTALALDLYGNGRNTEHPDEAKRFMTEAFNKMQQTRGRFDQARSVLAAHPTTDGDHIAAIGYCFGGAIVLDAARRGAPLRSVASFHGSLGTKAPAKPGAVTASLLVLHGAADPLVPKAEVDAFKKEMAQAKAKLRFVGYPGAKHAFTNPGADALGQKYKLPLQYDAKADAASWRELVQFFQQTLKAK